MQKKTNFNSQKLKKSKLDSPSTIQHFTQSTFHSNSSLDNPSTLQPFNPSTSDSFAVRVEGVSKKYCKSLKRSMLYGIKDIARNTFGLSSHSDKLRKNEFWALDDISFKVKKGETLGIIGPNGSGKTTLLKLLNGIFWPDKGKITVKGKVGALIEVGAGFHPLLTGRENIYINAAILGMTKEETDKKFDAIVEFADIGDFLDVPVKHYSSGMFVRLGFAIAVHCEPDILLVDEVLAVGDANFQRKSSGRMRKLIKNKNTSIILVSHNMQTVEAIADKTILLDKGRILNIGETHKIVPQYDLLMRPNTRENILFSESKNKNKDLTLINKFQGFGGDEILIKRVWLESTNGKRSTNFYSNEDVALCIYYKINSNITIKDGFIWVSFINEWDINCMGARLRLGDNGIPKILPESGVLRVCFKPIQLATSSYKVAIHFFDRTFSVPYSTGHYGYFNVINNIPSITPGINTPVCWPHCEWDLDNIEMSERIK
jgi:lipopolysaccharide transport system ATP-binding protein